MKHLSSWRNRKGCHGNESENDATTTYRFRYLTEIPVQKEVCGCAEHAKDGGVLPTSGFPRVSGMETSEKSDTVQTRASHTTHAFGPRRSSRHYTFEACVFGADRVGAM